MKHLIKLINESNAIEPHEKQEWIFLLKHMSKEHKAKLKDILTREKTKLAEIQDRYDKKAKKILSKI